MKKYDLRRILESYYSGGGARDERTGLGYGLTKARFHKTISMAGSFPYDDPDEYEDAPPADDEEMAVVRSKTPPYLPSDVLPKKGPNPVYFAESSARLSDCFWRTEMILDEIAAFGDSMVAIPHAAGSRKNSVSSGTRSAPYAGAGGSNYKRTGTKRGWSQAPPLSIVAAEESYDTEDDDEHIYSLQDLAKKE